MFMRRILVGVGALWALAVCAYGCGGSPYYLPAPPAKQEQTSVAANPAEQAELDRKRDLAARSALLKLYEALSKDHFEEAEKYLSQQTRDFLAYGSETGDPSAVLSEGKLHLPNGQTIAINPVKFLIGGNIANIENTMKGKKEHETSRRREFFVIDNSGKPHRVIMILEGDQWVLQKTSVNPNAG